LKKYITLILSLSIGFQSCNSEKKYSDYNEKDFYEVQGIITSAIPTSDPFDLPPMKDFKFDYFLSESYIGYCFLLSLELNNFLFLS